MPSIMPWKKWAYTPVALGGAGADADLRHQEEADEKNPMQEHCQETTAWTSRATAAGLFPLAATAAAVLFFALFVFMPRPWLASDHPVAYYSCGNSSQDATDAGCRFDVMSYTWVHPNCFDQELMYEFLAESDWHWYLDEDSSDQQALTIDEVTRGQHEYVYVTWKYYITHCTYMWRKMHRSLLTSRELDSYVSDYQHTEQCERVLMDRERQLDSKSVMLIAKYPSCPVPK